MFLRNHSRAAIAGLIGASLWSLAATAHPHLGERAISVDLSQKFTLTAQFDQRNPKTGHLDFSRDEDSGAISVAATPKKYHGPGIIDADYLFVDRDDSLSSSTLWSLRKGYLPLVRSLEASDGEDGGQVFVFEFATPVDISQLLNFSWRDDDEDDSDDEFADTNVSFYADIAGTALITPAVTYQNSCDDRHSKSVSLVAQSVRRIVVATNQLPRTPTSDNPGNPGNPGAGTDVPEPATALLLLPGLALLTAMRRRSRKDNDEDGTDVGGIDDGRIDDNNR